MTPESVQTDLEAGSLVGLASRDALGAGYEFGPPLTIEPEMKGGGPFGWQAGEWTDDTSMAICIAEAASSGQLDATDVAGRFLNWYRSNPPDVGNLTRAVLSATPTPQEMAGQAANLFKKRPKGSAGNGSLMRTAPVALSHLGDDTAVADAARRISDLTHGDPLAGDACVLWCTAIGRAILDGRLDGLRDGLPLVPADRRSFWDARIAEAETEPPGRFARNGYVVTALQAAYAAIHHTPVPADAPCLHFQQALRRAVQIGDDTDTVAAIAGSLLGARWGLTAIPAQWVTVLHGWPGLNSLDLIRIAVLAARRGRSDDAGWPTASSLIDYYATRYGSTPTAIKLRADPGVTVGNVAALRSLHVDPPDVIISLCRVGTDDIPAGAASYQLMLMDQPDAEQNPNLDFALHDLGSQIAAWRSEGKTVFVHCVMAQSRTPAVAAAYLAERFQMSGKQAIERVLADIPNARPNRAFLSALERLWPT